VNGYETGLTIKTTLEKAIKLYPLTRWNPITHKSNGFLTDWFIEFHTPQHNQALLRLDWLRYDKFWFALFDEGEKEAVEDEYRFYGVEYETTARQARRRVKNLLDKLEEKMLDSSFQEKRGQLDPSGNPFSERDKLRDTLDALDLLNPTDVFTITFNTSEESLSMDELKKKDYVESFKNKLFLKKVSLLFNSDGLGIT
jgi:hypothetical protein